MIEELKAGELVDLVRRVFAPRASDRQMAILVDLPDDDAQDVEFWRARREMAAKWHALLKPRIADAGLHWVDLVLYQNVRANNADLPAIAAYHPGGPLPVCYADMTEDSVAFDRVFKTHQILLAPTEFSATAPLKIAAKSFGFRAATMPGFDESMIPALKIDYGKVGARVDYLKAILDVALGCEILFVAGGREHRLDIDLRHRLAHASGGVFHEPGVAGNLPSGESYIVPYEGEQEGDPSGTAGEMPVQFGQDIVVYRIENNRAVEIISTNNASADEARRLTEEPAYGNLAELGFGVLGDFGLEPTGQILLDEKLGLHIAFGRSEHFGGMVGPKDFSSPDKVVHIDRVYIDKIQPKIAVASAILTLPGQEEMMIMEKGRYAISFEE
jgi:hypothetical protein